MTPSAELPDDGRVGFEPPEVTIVVPLYNGGRFIGETLRSVLAQTFGRFEVVVVDDGSTDDGPDVVRALGSDPRIRLVSGPHLGVASARNEGAVRASDGVPYVLFLDADDVWQSDTLATVVAALDRRPDAAGAFVLADYIDADGATLHAGDFPRHMRAREDIRDGRLVPRDVSEDVWLEHLFISNLVYPPSCLLMRRAAYDATGGFDGRFLAEDWEFVIRLAEWGPLVPVDRVLVGYRRHTENASANRARNIAGSRQVWATVYHARHGEARARIRGVWRAHQARTAARKLAEGRALIARGKILPGMARAADGVAHALLRHPPRLWMSLGSRSRARESRAAALPREAR